MPELTEASKHIMVEETKEGLNIEIVDQDGRSMFPEGSKEPYERTRRIIEKLAGTAQGDAVSGFHYRPHRGDPDPAAAIRAVEPVRGPRQCGAPDPGRGGPTSANFYEVAGKADTDPLFPDDPFMAANRRVTITLMPRRRRFLRIEP